MKLNPEACYQAMSSHDARFDGRFFTAVSSTGIYCRPVCRVKTPKRENCSFYPTAAEAEAAGYRPCLRCRPELAPGLTPVEASSRIAGMAALHIEEAGLEDESLESLAQRMGVSSRHLRRVFQEAYGVSPVQYLMTRRLLTAKTLLADTRLSVTQVAMISGFGSLRRFNALFRERYSLTPSELRKNTGLKQLPDVPIVLELGYRPPLDWKGLMEFLGLRAVPGVEWVTEGTYHRVVRISREGIFHSGWMTAADQPERKALKLTISPTLAAVLPQVIDGARYLFDLNCVPQHVDAVLREYSTVPPAVYQEGIRLPGCFDPFEMSVRAVLGQQISIKAARTLAMRFAEAFGTPVATPYSELTTAFPTYEAIAALPQPIADSLGPLGITGARARSIRALAEALAKGSLSLSRLADPESTRERLLLLPGIGPWTAEYITMRALSWPDAFPHTDLGIRKAYPDKNSAEIVAIAERYRPWRSYLTIMLWNTL